MGPEHQLRVRSREQCAGRSSPTSAGGQAPFTRPGLQMVDVRRPGLLVGAIVATLALASAAEAAPHPRHVLLGRSADGRPIAAAELRGRAPTATILVVGCIHGDEPAGIAVAQRLERLAPPLGVDLWVVPDLNPDGAAAATRGNGRGVDLNRNFPWRWTDLEGIHDSGARPLSEPESGVAARLVLRLRPRVSIWFHQQLGVVDLSGGDPAVERRLARSAGLPLVRLPRYPGSAVSWENAVLRGSTAFVVELPPGRLTAAAAARYARAVLASAARR